MNNRYFIENIRILLHKFYEGATTPEEEETLESFFNDTSDSNIHIDMVEDKRFFSELKDMHPVPSDTDIPGDLLEKINGIVSGSAIVQTSGKRKNPLKIFAYSSVAAIACILLMIETFYHKSSEEQITQPIIYIVSASESHEETMADEIQNTSRSSEMSNVLNSKNPGKNIPVITVEDPVEGEDGFIEISDPEEVKTIALEIGKLLSNNSDRTNDAISYIGNTIENYKGLTKTILQ